jgi:hypothetical protein
MAQNVNFVAMSLRSRPECVNVDLHSVTLYGGIFALSDTLCDWIAFLPNEKLRT